MKIKLLKNNQEKTKSKKTKAQWGTIYRKNSG
jgi:hypothetical protein